MASVASESTNGGHPDVRREETPGEVPQHRPTREELVDRAILEAVAERRHVFGKLGEHDLRFARIDGNIDLLIRGQQTINLAHASLYPAARDSVHDDDLEVSERTSGGTARSYIVTPDKLEGLKETTRRHAFVDFAAGEAERFQVAIAKDRAQHQLESAALPILFLRGKVLPAVLLAACIGAVTLWYDRIKALLLH